MPVPETTLLSPSSPHPILLGCCATLMGPGVGNLGAAKEFMGFDVDREEIVEKTEQLRKKETGVQRRKRRFREEGRIMQTFKM